MGRVIAITNQKGGVGKSTTTINLAACLAEKDKKVLAIDLDPQGNTTSGFGVEKDALEGTLYDLLLEEKSLDEVIVKNVVEGVDLIPSNTDLSGVEIELIGRENREYLLKNLIDQKKDIYDFVIMDCPPSLNMMTINALTASNSVLVPIQCEYYALEGLSQLLYTVNLVKERLNSGIEIEGVVLTMYDARTNLSAQVVDNVRKNMDKNIYKVVIPRSVRLAEAPSFGQPITEYDSKSSGADSYRRLAMEVIRRKEGA